MATAKNIRYCQILHDEEYYDVLVGLTDLDELDDVLQEWALANTDIGEELTLPAELIQNKDISELLTNLDLDNYVYVKSAVSAYMDFPRYAGVSGTFPTLPKVLVSGLYVMPACTAFLWSTALFTGIFGEYTIATASFTLVADEVNFIGIDYTAGAPVYKLYTSAASFNYSSIIPVCAILYFDSEVNVIPIGQAGYALPEKLLQNQKSRQEFIIVDDFDLAAVTLYVDVDAIVVNTGTGDITCLAMDTEDSDADMHLWYKDTGGDWQTSADNQINNTQYQSGSGLASLAGGEFVINYLFRAIDSANKVMFNVLSGKFSTLAEAKESDMITDLPDAIKEGCVLVGRMIVEKDSSSPTVQKIQRVRSFGTVS
jgi:hypothetical protein